MDFGLEKVGIRFSDGATASIEDGVLCIHPDRIGLGVHTMDHSPRAEARVFTLG